MIEAIIIGFVLSCAKGIAGWRIYVSSKRKRLLEHTDKDPVGIPVIDSYLESRAGELNQVEQFMSNRIVQAARKVVHTKAFEHVVVMFLNRRKQAVNDGGLNSSFEVIL